MSLAPNLQHKDGYLIVFIIMNQDRIQSVCDTLGTAQEKLDRLAKLGFDRDAMVIESYRMVSK